MKRIFPLFSLAVFAFTLMAFQAGNQLELAMKTGNAAEISKQFGATVELKLDGQEGTYSKAQATEVLKSWFNVNRPTGYETVHRGNSSGNLTYSIGLLHTDSGDFRSVIYMKKVGTTNTIQSISIDPE